MGLGVSGNAFAAEYFCRALGWPKGEGLTVVVSIVRANNTGVLFHYFAPLLLLTRCFHGQPVARSRAQR